MDPHSILKGLEEAANTLWPLAAGFHVALAAALFALREGWRPSQRAALAWLAVPTLSVAVAASLQGNPFNATVFALATLGTLGAARAAPREPVQTGPTWAAALGGLGLAYAWVYPHFLQMGSPWMYLVAAPVGVVPCPTLALVGGFALWGGGLGAQRWLLGLAALTLFYAAFGMAVLGVWLDAGLALAGLGLSALAATQRRAVREGKGLAAKGAERARIDAFLALRRIALVGASSRPHHFSRVVMRELLAQGIDVVPVHPSAETVEGRRAFPGLEVVDPPVEGVLVMTPRELSAETVRQAADLGVRRIWLHRGAGPGAVSDEAVQAAREAGLELVAGRCPLMFVHARPAGVHRLHAATLKLTGDFPK